MNDLASAATRESGWKVASSAPGPSSLKVTPTEEEVRRVTWFLFVSLFGPFLAMFIVFIPGNRLLQDPDLYWHTAAGRWIWETWSFPQVAEFSHTFRDRPWIARDWLADLTFYGATSLMGWRGLAMLTGGAIAVVYGLLFLMLARTMRLTVAIGLVALLPLLTLGHLHARTQILADGLIVLWVGGWCAQSIRRLRRTGFSSRS